jgi:hypothetical protein
MPCDTWSYFVERSISKLSKVQTAKSLRSDHKSIDQEEYDRKKTLVHHRIFH